MPGPGFLTWAIFDPTPIFPNLSQLAKNFDQHIDNAGSRLALEKDEQGHEQLRWYGHLNGEPTTFTTEPYTNFWRRFTVWFMRLMPIESQI